MEKDTNSTHPAKDEIGGHDHRNRQPEVEKQLHNRIRRIVGQVQGIERMIENDRYCIDILNQIQAVRSALHSLGMVLLRDHLQGCVTEAIRNEEGMDAEKAREELLEILDKFTKQ